MLHTNRYRFLLPLPFSIASLLCFDYTHKKKKEKLHIDF